MNRKAKDIIEFVVSVGICELAGAIGAIYTMPAIATWYAGLTKPGFTPPSWLFGPVWTLLYLLMGIAFFLVWSSFAKISNERERGRAKTAFGVFAIQLVLNILWSIIFFGSQNPFAGFIAIIALWLAIIATIMAFGKISRTAAWILVPYLLWVTFAAVLNLSIVVLN